MRHIQGEDRHQVSLLPDALDDFVAADHPVRVIDAYVDTLDFASLGFSKAQTKETGRKPYHPGDLLKLYVYGYLNRVTSSRRLETECHRNLEVLWLLKRLQPDFKTIADFRKENGSAIENTCRAFIAFCRHAAMLNGRLVAIDGSKFKSAASKDQMLTRRQLKRDRAQVADRIERYLKELDEADREDGGIEFDREAVKQVVERLRNKAQRLDEREARMDMLGTDQHCATEEEARLVRSGRDGTIVGYNVQTAVDAETGFILHHAVSNDTGDNRQLLPMAEQAQAALGASELEVLADAGYSNGQQLAECEDLGITPIIPRRVVPSIHLDMYQKSDFHYDAQQDHYTCPAGEILKLVGKDERRKLHLYRRSGCDACAMQINCTASNKRVVTRHFFEAAFDRATARVKANPRAMAIRMGIAERPFAILKQGMSLRRFSCWGIRGARSEAAIGVLAYNLKRIISLRGVSGTLELLT